MEIKLGKHVLGASRPALIVAEMSGNHGGGLERSLEIVRASARAGADAIKLQTYTADTITLKSDRDDFRIPCLTPWASHKTLWDLYRTSFTPWEWHKTIFDEAKNLGLEVFSSPFDESAVDFLDQLGVPAFKIASPEITHIPLLKKVAKTGKPIIISTGIATLADIDLALTTLRDAGAKDIVILKCTTAYPAPLEDSNLLTIQDIPGRFGVLSGLSDHSLGVTAPLMAIAFGASVIEKHFTLDDGIKTVDSFFSSGEQEFSDMVRDIRQAEKSIGKVSYEIASSAQGNTLGRRSIYVSDFIKAGDIIQQSNIKIVRPSYGMHPKFYDQVLGRRAKCDLKIGDRLTWDVID